jgi:hypothetical protein
MCSRQPRKFGFFLENGRRPQFLKIEDNIENRRQQHFFDQIEDDLNFFDQMEDYLILLIKLKTTSIFLLMEDDLQY